MLSAQIEAVPTCRAVILSAYGSGNLPLNPEGAVLQALEKAVQKEILVVVISQCSLAYSRDMKLILDSIRRDTERLPALHTGTDTAQDWRIARLRLDT